MSLLHESDATLRFFGDSLDPNEITTLLRIAPTVGVARGATWRTSLGCLKVASTGSWRLEVGRRTPGDLDEHISDLLALPTSDLRVWRDLTSRFEADIFLGLWLGSFNEGFELSNSMLANVASRGLRLSFDIYERERGEGDGDGV